VAYGSFPQNETGPPIRASLIDFSHYKHFPLKNKLNLELIAIRFPTKVRSLFLGFLALIANVD
jgi:hypothetical protein